MNSYFAMLPRWRRRLRSAAFASISLFAGVAGLAGPPNNDGVAVVQANRAPLVSSADPGEFVADMGVARWHRQGHRGQGTKIAILDSGFRGYRQFLGKTLPSRVKARSFRSDNDLEARDSQHGVLCAEVIATLAPDAELLFANWEPESPQSFVDALRWAKSEGARVVSCSVIMPGWSDGNGGGPVHDAMKPILGTGQNPRGMLFFAPAGNLAQRHWTGPLEPDAAGRHQWSPGVTRNRVHPWDNDRLAVELYGPVGRRCTLQLYDLSTGLLLHEVEHRPGAGPTAIRLRPEPGRQYAVELRCLESATLPVTRSSAPAERFHLVALGGNLDEVKVSGSIPFPGDGAQVVTVGAVDDRQQRLPYSSCGPNSPRPKPDFVAQVPFPIRARPRPFTGTSAAAPQAAALAALLLGRNPAMTPDQVHHALRTSAVDLLAPGHDSETGFGRLQLR